jgi:hypothetical protein
VIGQSTSDGVEWHCAISACGTNSHESDQQKAVQHQPHVDGRGLLKSSRKNATFWPLRPPPLGRKIVGWVASDDGQQAHARLRSSA